MRRIMGVFFALLLTTATTAAAPAQPSPETVEKLMIHVLSADRDLVDTFEVQFNPKEYTIEQAAPWQSHSNAGLDNPRLEWTSGESMSLSMELLFETTESGPDVREQVELLQEMVPRVGEKHRPPLLLVTWGTTFPHFRGVMDTIRVKYSRFMPDGTPLRATVKIRFTEFTPAEERRRQ